MSAVHLADRVRGQLVSGIADTDTALDVEVTGAIWQAPPEPAAGRVGVVVVTDDLQSPGAVEVIHYNGRTDLGGGQWQLTGLLRGAEGTAAAAWNTGAHILGPLTVRALAAPGLNLLVNADGAIDQYLHSVAVSDATYGPDRWLTLVESGQQITPAVEQVDRPAGSLGAIKLTADAAAGQFGIMQPLEARDSLAVIGGQASFQVKIKATGVAKVGLALLEWSGSADAITRAAVSAWNGPGAVPTFAADWNAAASAIVDAPTAWGAPLALEGVAIDPAAANVAVFVWADDDAFSAGADSLLVAAAKLEEGPIVTPYVQTPFALMWAACQQWRQRTYLASMIDGYSGPGNAQSAVRAMQGAAVTNLPGLQWRFPFPMRAPPAVTIYATGSGTVGAVRNLTVTADVTISSTSAHNALATGMPIASSAPSEGHELAAHYVAAAEL